MDNGAQSPNPGAGKRWRALSARQTNARRGIQIGKFCRFGKIDNSINHLEKPRRLVPRRFRAAVIRAELA
jgi:hypothetical protein